MWSFASFWAKDWPDPFPFPDPDPDLDPVRLRKSVARKKRLGDVDERGPWAWEAGQNDGTMLWMAFREVCSPWGGRLVSGVSIFPPKSYPMECNDDTIVGRSIVMMVITSMDIHHDSGSGGLSGAANKASGDPERNKPRNIICASSPVPIFTK